MNKINKVNKKWIWFDWTKLIEETISSIVITSVCKVADILDFWKKQIDKVRFLLQEKKRFNK